jgi:hypothetical protein
VKKHLLRLSIIAALAASASFAETYNLNVPFDFVAWNKTMPAGTYLMDRAAGSAPGVLIMRSLDRKTTFVVMGSSATSEGNRQGKLVFHRYGNRYFLAEVWTRGSDGGHLLRVTPQERELRAQGKIRQAETTIAAR